MAGWFDILRRVLAWPATRRRAGRPYRVSAACVGHGGAAAARAASGVTAAGIASQTGLAAGKVDHA